jgi:hypothetical protein
LTTDWRQTSFDYVADPKLRAILEQFHAEACSADDSERPIAAVILCGAVLEGMLAFALRRRDQDATTYFRKSHNSSKPLTQWTLEEMIDVAAGIELIGTGPAKGANAIRDFRNLIHPDKLTRRSAPRWPALAKMALAAVADVSASLKGRI